MFQRVMRLDRIWACKTKRLHWFNFGLHLVLVEA